MSKNKAFERYSKNFINDDKDEYGTLCWSVTVDSYSDESKYRQYADLRIQDCHQTINLDFNVGTNRNSVLDRRIEKLNTIIEMLEDMRSAMIEGGDILMEKNKDFKDESSTETNITITSIETSVDG